jgi:hypothetical protein
VAVIEKALLNPQEVMRGGPGVIARLDNTKLGPNGDVKNAFAIFDRPDIKRGAGFTEVYEWERIAQERTSANRATLGTSGQVRDANRTLGGQELLLEQSGEKFAYVGMVIEFAWLYELFRKTWKISYLNLTPQKVLEILGPERAARFRLLTPEEIESRYVYIPQGIFEQENRDKLFQSLQALWAQFSQAPWIDPLKVFEKQAKVLKIDPTDLVVPEAQAVEIMAKAQMMAQGMAQQMIAQKEQMDLAKKADQGAKFAAKEKA